MPRSWLHRQTRCRNKMPTELTILRGKNPSNEHPNFISGESSHVAAHCKGRLVSQNGRIKVANSNVPGKHERYIDDLFTTILDMPFRWILGIYSMVYLASWLGFGTIWFIIHRVRESKGYDEYYCVEKVDSWTSAFLFSIETQTTIGYGGRQVTPNCPEGVVLLLIQTLVGSFIAATLLGIVFAKASRPKKRSRTVLFSEKAVIGMRDDNLCLMFRVADLRASQLLECHIQVEMFYTRQTNEGELPYFHEKLSIGNGFESEGEGEEIYYTFMIIPNTIAHVINKDSPLYSMSSLDMLKANVELVVFLEGVIESTGLTMQARTSYTANEIVWGCNFVPMPRHDDLFFKGELEVDFCHFNKFQPVSKMPVCSRGIMNSEDETKGEESASDG
ncbi:inward rectifier potassium channel 2-like [Dendronephthya gigantea]|uniref:inward rectifier potassium channel 2-like n=1 Tax=Dendronephthya gigantea TaxID=151771 RepID=UPI00106A0246|nr:inward rectifier potassium channel 2-like [Dendronephthya gigantea]